MSRAKATDFPLLLEVFREGLVYGIISRDEIVAWADQIIGEEDEPDYFFIELSLSKNTNGLIEVLDQYTSRSESPIPFRVLMGHIYHKLIDDNGPLTLKEAAVFVGRTTDCEIPTLFESTKAYTFEDYEFFYLPDVTQLQVDILNFLSIYKGFNLYNYDRWPEINILVEETLKPEEEKLQASRAASEKIWKKREAKRKLKRYALFGLPILILIGIILINCKKMQGEPTISQMLLDHENLFFLDVFVFYFTLRVVYMVWKKKRRFR
jgi:hypothetical protein